jgi:hypothetical protein
MTLEFPPIPNTKLGTRYQSVGDSRVSGGLSGGCEAQCHGVRTQPKGRDRSKADTAAWQSELLASGKVPRLPRRDALRLRPDLDSNPIDLDTCPRHSLCSRGIGGCRRAKRGGNQPGTESDSNAECYVSGDPNARTGGGRGHCKPCVFLVDVVWSWR